MTPRAQQVQRFRRRYGTSLAVARAALRIRVWLVRSGRYTAGTIELDARLAKALKPLEKRAC